MKSIVAVWCAFASLVAAQGAVAQGLLPGEREANVVAIPESSRRHEMAARSADFETADGIDGTPDGAVIFAQEQTDTIRKLDASGKE